MNVLIIAVAVLAAAVTLLVVEATPKNLFGNPSLTCCFAEPLCGTADQGFDEGCTCSGSWQPHCCCLNRQCCPNPRLYMLTLYRLQQPMTFYTPSCSAPPAAMSQDPYKEFPYFLTMS